MQLVKVFDADDQQILLNHHQHVLWWASPSHFHAGYAEYKAQIAIETLQVFER